MPSAADTDRAAAYLAAIPPAPQGNRNDALNRAAYALLERFDLSSSEHEQLMLEWASRCSPPIIEAEALRTIRSAWSAAHAAGVIASKARPASSFAPRRAAATNGHRKPAPTPAAPPQRPSEAPRYDLASGELPQPLPDGACALLRIAFDPSDGVRITPAVLSDDGTEIPDPHSANLVLTRDEWLRRFSATNGDPNAIWSSSARTGIYITINPMRPGGNKDADVTAYRHALLEFDDISITEQWALYQQSRIPCSAVILSGGKSLHAWVRVDAQDRQEYAERVRLLYEHFASYKPDPKNRNPSRYSRLPNCIRFDKRQELVAVNIGCDSFTEWLSESQAEGIGTVTSLADLLAFKSEQDPNTLLGNRYLCKGGSALLIGPSGIGKSSLAMQMSVSWALGRPFYGIAPVRPLKSLFIQAENDKGDLAEMVQGVLGGFGVDTDFNPDEITQLASNTVFVRDTTRTGFGFTQAAHKLIDKHRPDLVWLDPLLSFIGADISRQEVCSQFLREWLNPISEATGVVWIGVHHTGKPPGDKKARDGWTSSDHAYAGIGSSELVNWARAVLVLRQANDLAFELKLAKRGKRAGAVHPDDTPTNSLWLRHADHGIHWLQTDPPEESASQGRGHGDGKRGRPSQVERLIEAGCGAFIDATSPGGESLRAITQRLSAFAAERHGIEVSPTQCRVAIAQFINNGVLTKNAAAKYVRK